MPTLKLIPKQESSQKQDLAAAADGGYNIVVAKKNEIEFKFILFYLQIFPNLPKIHAVHTVCDSTNVLAETHSQRTY